MILSIDGKFQGLSSACRGTGSACEAEGLAELVPCFLVRVSLR